jgi:hypothetical protein
MMVQPFSIIKSDPGAFLPRRLLLFFMLMLMPVVMLYGQVDEVEEEVEPIPEERVSVFALKKYVQIGASTGFMRLFAELDNDINPAFHNRIGGGFQANYGITPSVTLGLAFTTGSLYGQIRSDSTSSLFTNLNVRTTTFVPQIRLGYHFAGHYHNHMPGVFQPWVFAGIGCIFFNPLADLTNDQGVPYHYWSDGSIRDLPETPDNLAKAGFMSRDYFFETVLRDADFDGLGPFPKVALAIPAGIGFDINLNHHFALLVGATFHYTFTDQLDNIARESGNLDPSRAIGKPGNDAFLLFHAGISFKHYEFEPIERGDLNIPPPSSLPVDFRPFDLNGNDAIDRDEVLQALEDFFNGESPYPLELIELLIDFYNIRQLLDDRIRY